MLAGRMSVGAALASAFFVVLAGSTARVGRADTTLHWNGRIAYAPYTGLVSMNPDGSGRLSSGTILPGDAGPAWSPDGTVLAVAQNWQGKGGIRLQNPDGTTLAMLTTTQGDASPTWSPDGSRIAYVNSGHLYVVFSPGGAIQTELGADDGLWKSTPAWSPDGTRIAFQAYDPQGTGSEIYLLDLQSGRESEVTGGFGPAWSPDGSRLALWTYGPTNSELRLVNPDGSGLTTLGAGSSPAWSPDGTQIAFLRGGDVWTVSPTGAGLQQLTFDGQAGDGGPAPAWQPLGPPPARCTIWGTDAPDLLVGSNDDDVICGLGGDDTLIGLGGNDVLNGGDGNDHLAGGLGRDVLIGGSGSDTIDARDGGPDVVKGGGGVNDRAIADGPQDRVSGARVTVSQDIAAWRPVTASNSTAGQPPLLAVDGRYDDFWNGGNYPPQWIEIDLQKPTAVARIRLTAADNPSGSAFLILGRGRGTNGATILLGRIKGATSDDEVVTLKPKKPWRGIRYLRIATAAPPGYGNVPWVSWHEIEVFAAA
jgi:Ca2+-binding RTX toxin-like protein